MICLQTVKRFCEEYWEIENYQEAVNDTTQIWDCHHRHEIDWVLPREELIAIGRYYNVHYSELIFLTHSEHARLHMLGKKPWNTGKTLPQEQRNKISISLKGRKREPFSEEWKRKISDSRTKYHITKEELYDLYVVQGLSQCQIAEMYGCHQTSILQKLKKYNIKK